jgi:hypothetical protein
MKIYFLSKERWLFIVSKMVDDLLSCTCLASKIKLEKGQKSTKKQVERLYSKG